MTAAHQPVLAAVGQYVDDVLKVHCSKKVVDAASTLSGFSFKTPETLFVNEVCLSKIV